MSKWGKNVEIQVFESSFCFLSKNKSLEYLHRMPFKIIFSNLRILHLISAIILQDHTSLLKSPKIVPQQLTYFTTGINTNTPIHISHAG